jgi:Major Facilitator Superfamily
MTSAPAEVMSCYCLGEGSRLFADDQTAESTAPPIDEEAGQARRGLILGGLMLAMGLAALDTTIVATAVPSIVREFNGFSHFPWVFSAYLLAIAVTTPVYGRMADIIGRKPVLMFGILLLPRWFAALRRVMESVGAHRLPWFAGVGSGGPPAAHQHHRG